MILFFKINFYINLFFKLFKNNILLIQQNKKGSKIKNI